MTLIMLVLIQSLYSSLLSFLARSSRLSYARMIGGRS